MQHRRVRALPTLVVAMVGALFLARCDDWSPVEVSVETIGRGRVERTIINSKAGTVKARRRANLSPEIGGRVAFIGFREGERVSRGDVLLRLDDQDLQAGVKLSEREHEAAMATEMQVCLSAELAGRDLQRNHELSRDNIVSEEMLDQLESRRDAERAACDATRANTRRSSAAVELARARLAKTVLRAPFDGVVAEVGSELGEWVTPSPPIMAVPGILDLIDPSSIYVSAPVDEVDSASIQAGLPARITLDPYPGQALEGKVVRVAPYVLDIQEQNRTVEIECDFVNLEINTRLLPGTSADVEIILEAHDEVLRVPAHALLEGDRVLVLEDDHLEERQLEIGLKNWDYAEILGGLSEGDRVVVSLDRAEVRAGARAVAKQ
ncbi:MAG: efflux RND transporter periplasmic adaptor subunit [Acidobacteria bacterium]|nr:efflux RND transporter periplasmic adaptor subunit [Acidobacteriota bacterium]